jgi:acyl-CoA dehydrogenase
LNTPGVKVERILTVFGYDDAPEGHAEVSLDCRVPVSNMILREGAGFEISQGRLGPGRLHHCMRTIGVCEAAQELMIKRASNRVAFGMKLVKHEVVATNIALNRMEIDQARMMVLYTAASIDKHGDTRYVDCFRQPPSLPLPTKKKLDLRPPTPTTQKQPMPP